MKKIFLSSMIVLTLMLFGCEEKTNADKIYKIHIKTSEEREKVERLLLTEMWEYKEEYAEEYKEIQVIQRKHHKVEFKNEMSDLFKEKYEINLVWKDLKDIENTKANDSLIFHQSLIIQDTEKGLGNEIETIVKIKEKNGEEKIIKIILKKKLGKWFVEKKEEMDYYDEYEMY